MLHGPAQATPVPQRAWQVDLSPTGERIRCTAAHHHGPIRPVGRTVHEAALAHLADHARSEPLAEHLRTCRCRAHGCTWHPRHRGCAGPITLVVFRRHHGRTWHLADTCTACAHAIPHAAEVTPAPTSTHADGGDQAPRTKHRPRLADVRAAQGREALRAALGYLDAALSPAVPPAARLLALVCLLRADATGATRLPVGLLRALRLHNESPALIACLSQEQWLLPGPDPLALWPHVPRGGLVARIADLATTAAPAPASRRTRRRLLDQLTRGLTPSHLRHLDAAARLAALRRAADPGGININPPAREQDPLAPTSSMPSVSCLPDGGARCAARAVPARAHRRPGAVGTARKEGPR
jgi:hypothetical protein